MCAGSTGLLLLAHACVRLMLSLHVCVLPAGGDYDALDVHGQEPSFDAGVLWLFSLHVLP